MNNMNNNAMANLHNSFNLQEVLKRAIKYLIEGTAVAQLQHSSSQRTNLN